MDLYLASGDQNLADAVCLDDGIATFIPSQMIAVGGTSLPAGVTFSPRDRGLFATKSGGPALPYGARTVTLTVICSGPDTNAVEAAWRAVVQKLQQAELASGPYGIGQRVVLWYRPGGATEYTFWDVLGGTFTYAFMGMPDGSPFKAGLLTLYVAPYGRGKLVTAPAVNSVTANTLLSGASQLYYPGVLGDVEALCRVEIEDESDANSRNAINRVTIGRRWLRGLAATDFSPYLKATPAGAAVTFPQSSDGTIINPSGCARLSGATSSLQQMASVFPGTGPQNAGLFDLYLRVRDYAVVPYAPASVAASASQSGGSIPANQLFTYVLTTQDSAGHESLPSAAAAVSTPQPVSSFFDDCNAGDPTFPLWDAFGLSVSGVNASYAALTPTQQAAYEGSFGYHAEAGIAAGANTAKAFLTKNPGTGRIIADIQFRLRVNQATAQSGTTPCFPYIPIFFDSSNNPVMGFQYTGTAWQWGVVSGSGALGEMGTVTTVPFPTTNEWVQVEVQVAQTAPALVWIWVNGAQVVSGANMGNHTVSRCGIGAIAETGGSGTGAANLSVDFDLIYAYTDFIGEGAGKNTVTWQAAQPLPASGSYNLYWQENGGRWHKVNVGTALSYSHTSLTAGSLTDPPSAAPAIAPAQFQAAVGIAAGGSSPSVLQYGPIVSAQVSNGEWELLKVGTFALPPDARQQQMTSSDAWVIPVYARYGGSSIPITNVIDVDTAYLVPVGNGEDVVIAEWPGATNTSHYYTWQIDTRYDGLTTVRLVQRDSAEPGLGQDLAVVTGRLSLGPGDNQLAVLVETTDGNGHFIHERLSLFHVKVYYVPRYEHTRGVA